MYQHAFGQVSGFDIKNPHAIGLTLLAATADGVAFKGVSLASYKELAGRLPPSW